MFLYIAESVWCGFMKLLHTVFKPLCIHGHAGMAESIVNNHYGTLKIKLHPMIVIINIHNSIVIYM